MRQAFPIAAALGASLAGLIAGGARAEDPKTTTDIRCMVVAFSLIQNDDPSLKQLGAATLIYFKGRLQGREGTADLNGRVVDAAATMTADDIKSQAATCEAMVSAAGQDIQNLAQALHDRLAGGAPPK